jgi:hypothetical protein
VPTRSCSNNFRVALIGLSHSSLSNLGSGSEVPDGSPGKPVPITPATRYVNGGPEPDGPSLPGQISLACGISTVLVTPGRHRAVKKPTRGLPDQVTVPCNSIKKSYGSGSLDLGSGRFGLDRVGQFFDRKFASLIR